MTHLDDRTGDDGLARLERIEVRSMWANEAHDFTPWLHENIHLLAEELGIEIDGDLLREVPVGGFWADLVGRDAGGGATILIENQLEATDHRHLGQLLTYAGGIDAGVLVWVATSIGDEHRQALLWLNERTGEETLFFGVEIELLSIDGSRPAPHFKVVAAPNDWQKRAAGSGRSGGDSELDERYRTFWSGLVSALRAERPDFTTTRPERAPRSSWWGRSLGRSAFTNNIAFGWEGSDRVVRSEVYIDTGDRDQTKATFDALLAQRSEIEAALGHELTWDRRDDIRAAKAYVTRPGSIHDSDDALRAHREWALRQMLGMHDAFERFVLALDLGAIPPGTD